MCKSLPEVVNVEVALTNPTVLFQEPPANVFGLGSTSVPVYKYKPSAFEVGL